MVDRADEVLARSEGYATLARILAGRVKAGDWDTLREAGVDVPEDADSLAAEHYGVFGLNVFPYAGVFLSADGLMGGAEADFNSAFYARIGLPLNKDADHIGQQLAVLSWLAGAEADALQDGAFGQAARMRSLRRQLLQERVLTWLPALVQAVGARQSVVYGSAASLALDLAVHDREALGEDVYGADARFVLPPVPDLLDDPKTGLHDIAAWLMTPALSGIYLSRDDVMQLGIRHGIPTGFAERRTLLHNVLRAAVSYEVFSAVVEELLGTVVTWAEAMKAQMLPQAEVWAERAGHTAGVLQRLRDALPPSVGRSGVDSR